MAFVNKMKSDVLYNRMKSVDPISEGTSLSQMIFFTLGYFLGGATSMVLLGLAVAARRGDGERSERGRVQLFLDNVPSTEDES